MREIEISDLMRDFNYKLVQIFGDTPRIKILEFFIYLYSKTHKNIRTYISQISRMLKLSKSSVKRAVEKLIASGILIEKKEITHAKNPKRHLGLNLQNSVVEALIRFYELLKDKEFI